MWQMHLVIAGLWLVYCAMHSSLAATSSKKKLQKGRPFVARFYRLGYNLIAFAGLAIIVLLQVSTPSPMLFVPATLSVIVGGVIGVSGVLIMAVCIRKYFNGLSGLQNLWQEQAKDRLIVTGIHRTVRHPLYLGTFMALWGAWLCLPTLSFLLSNFIITIYTLIGICFEERKLIAAFGEDYIRYRKQVPKLIPRFRATGND